MNFREGGAPPARPDPARERIAAAAVYLIGTRGFAQTSVEAICEQARSRRSHFERCFAGKEDCFLCLHDEVVAELCERVRAAHADLASWHDRLWAAGWAALRFFQEDPARGRFLMVEINGVGAGAQARRDALLSGLADILDGGRAELGKPQRASRCTAEIIAAAIFGTLTAKLEAGAVERGEDFLPELVYMAVLPYLGSEAAERELAVQTLR